MKLNPGLKHGFPSLSGLRSLAKEAKDHPAERYSFQQFNLNIWHGNSRDPLFSMATYDARCFVEDETDLEMLPCWVGVVEALGEVGGIWPNSVLDDPHL